MAPVSPASITHGPSCSFGTAMATMIMITARNTSRIWRNTQAPVRSRSCSRFTLSARLIQRLARPIAVMAAPKTPVGAISPLLGSGTKAPEERAKYSSSVVAMPATAPTAMVATHQ
jgi:hypothetical protein